LQAQREHVLALAVSKVEPTVKAVSVPKPGKPKKGEAQAAWSESMSARPPRG